ncbi:MAG: DUF2937 family protein [Alphaproteobacteria bacterium]|nr:DUF2937 family protein [Alphaproteobacteria bacterium]
MARVISRIANGVVAVLGAAAGAQFPAFYAQYLQRLSGRLDQARIEAGRLAHIAEAAGLRVADYIERLLANADLALRAAGGLHKETLNDSNTLGQAQIDLAGALGFARPLAFARHFDLDLALATLHDFQPAMPLTLEAAAFALAGLLLAGMFGRLAFGAGGNRRRRRRA